MPPSDRLSGALSIASTLVGIASGLGDLGMFSKSASAGLTSSASTVAGGLGQSANLLNPVTIGGYLDPFAGIG